MRVRQLMSSPVITVSKNVEIANAIELLRSHRISRLVVVDQGRVVGVITEKDIARELASVLGRGVRVARPSVSGLMSASPITVDPEVTAKRAAEMMLERGISGLPVVENSSMVGILTKLDFAKLCREFSDVFVGEVMEPEPFTAGPEDRLLRAWRLMKEENVSTLPVVEGDRLVGSLSVREIALTLGSLLDCSGKRQDFKLREILIGDIMVQPAPAVRSDSELPCASGLMLGKRVSGLPVVDSRGTLVGVLTKTELAEVVRERL